ncbi:MAG: hypothetical protein AVDCRST_MAG06-2150, partial [uncultured Nocardioides sp.]
EATSRRAGQRARRVHLAGHHPDHPARVDRHLGVRGAARSVRGQRGRPGRGPRLRARAQRPGRPRPGPRRRRPHPRRPGLAGDARGGGLLVRAGAAVPPGHLGDHGDGPLGRRPAVPAGGRRRRPPEVRALRHPPCPHRAVRRDRHPRRGRSPM